MNILGLRVRSFTLAIIALALVLGFTVQRVGAVTPSVTPVAANDVYTTASDAPITALMVPAPGLLANDYGETLTAIKVTNPTHGSATVNADGSFTYTPSGPYAGPDSFQYKVNDGHTDSAPATVTITVTHTNAAPAITSMANATFTVGTMGSFTITTTGFPIPTIGETGALPMGVTFTDNHDGTATLSGTPAMGTGNTYTLMLTASNGVGAPAMQTFTLTVNQAPSITSMASATFTVGTMGSFTVTTSGVPAVTTISEMGALPMGVTFMDNGNGTATLSGTPAAGTGNTYSLTLTASNGIMPNATQMFTLTVNEAPAITSATSTTFTLNMMSSFSVTTTSFPKPTLSESGALPTGVTFTDNMNGTATLSGTPTQGGVFPLTLTASNGVMPNATQMFTLNVTQPPSITSMNSATFTVGTMGSFTVMTSGVPTVNTISEMGALPMGVTFVNNMNGTATLSGTPAVGTGGSYMFTITASNGVMPSATQTFTLTVNEAPAITSTNSATFTVGTMGSFSVTATGFPKPTLSEMGTLPMGVTFTDNMNGSATLSGTPMAGTGGSYMFTITAHNTSGSDATQMFTLTVNEPPTITSTNSATFTVGTMGSFSVTTTGFPKPTLSESGALPTGVTFTDNMNGTATLSGTPMAGTGGSYMFTITASNGIMPNATQTFTLTIDEPPTITSGTSATFREGVAGMPFTVTTTGFPKPMISTMSTLPMGVTLMDNGNGTATLSGTPAVSMPETGAATTYNLTITANNGVTPNAMQMFTLTVKPQLPVATADSYTATGGVNISVVAASGVLANDQPHGATLHGFGPASGTADGTIPNGMNSVTTANGGTVVLAADGSFTYDPPVTPGTDAFYYTLANTAGDSVQAKVTLTVSDQVIFVNTNTTVMSGNNGSFSKPFKTLAAAGGVAAVTGLNKSLIYTYSGTYTSDSITLKTSQALIGQGVDFTTALGRAGISLATNSAITAPGANTKPVVGGTVTLASTTIVHALDISSGASNGLVGSSVSGVTVGNTGGTGNDTVSVTAAGGVAVNLTSAGGTFTFVQISANGGSNGINLSNTTGTFTVTGDGASDPANTTRGRTTAKNGGGTITPGAGGTIQNATGAGIVLNNVGTVVLTSMVVQNNGGAGVNSGGNGITATTVNTGLTLDNVKISGQAGNYGLNGTRVSGLTLQHTEISGNATDSNVINGSVHSWNVGLTSLGGTATFANSLFSNSYENVVGVTQNGTDTVTLNVTNSRFDTATTNETFNFTTNGNANSTISITGSSITLAKTTGFQYAGNDDSYGSVTVDNNQFGSTTAGDQNGVDIDIDHQGGNPTSASNSRQLTFEVSGNTTRQSFKTGTSVSINIDLAGNSTSGSKMVGTVKGNTIGNSGVANSGSDLGAGVQIHSQGNGTLTIAMKSNTLNQVRGMTNSVVFILNGTGTTSPYASTLNLYLHDNIVNAPSEIFGAGFEIDNGANTGDSGTMFIDVGNNITPGNNSATVNAGAIGGLTVQNSGGSPTTDVMNYTGAANDATAIANYITSKNGTFSPPVQVTPAAGTIQGTGTSPVFPT